MSSYNKEFSCAKNEIIISSDGLIKRSGSNNSNNNNNAAILDLERRINLAKGDEMADLIVQNAKIVNVFSGEIHQTDVAIADGIFVGFGKGYNSKNLYDAQGRFMSPGLIDGHIHLESIDNIEQEM